jgi:hypothetical protein
VILLAVALCGGVAEAQGQGGRRPGGPGGPGGPARDEAFKMVDAYFVSNLQESVGLTDEQFVKLLQLVKKYQDTRRELAARRMRALIEMKKQLEAGTATEGSIAERLAELKTVETDESTVLRGHRDAIDQTLSKLQQAKFRILEAEVERKIRMLMNQIRPGAARRQGAPAGGDE